MQIRRRCCAEEGRAHELAEPLPYRNPVANLLAQSASHDAAAWFRTSLSDFIEPSAPFGLLDVYRAGTSLDAVCLVLDTHLAREVRAQAWHLRKSPSVLFHAAWALVVADTSCADDVVIDSVLRGQLQSGSREDRSLGMFINTVPLRLTLRDVSIAAIIGVQHLSFRLSQRKQICNLLRRSRHRHDEHELVRPLAEVSLHP